MKRIRSALALAAFACFAIAACGSVRGDASGVIPLERAALQRPSGPARPSDVPVPLPSPTAECAPSAAPGAAGGCPIIGVAELDGVVARAVSGLQDTTAADGWSRACAWLRASGGSGEPDLLTVQIGWQGSLHEYSALPGASPIAGLADEAYALDDGDRIALRSGELVAVVRYSGLTALTEALARQVAQRLPE